MIKAAEKFFRKDAAAETDVMLQTAYKEPTHREDTCTDGFHVLKILK